MATRSTSVEQGKGYGDLFTEDKLHISVYTDPRIFDEEMKRIFYTVWNFVGHDSQVPEPGDFIITQVGVLPMVLIRDAKRGPVAYLNSARAFGGGPLVVTTSGNHDDLRDMAALERELGLQPMARVDSYQGFVFGSMAPEGPTLMEHLGLAAEWFDHFVDRAPEGTITFRGGDWRHVYLGNWKFQVEGSNEGYHVEYLHRISRLGLARAAGQGGKGGRSTIGAGNSHGFNLANGHSLIFFQYEDDEVWRAQYPPDYLAMMEDKLGKKVAARVLGLTWRLVVYPNLNLAGNHVRMTYPITHEEAEIRQWNIVLDGAPPRMQAGMIKGHQGFYGPAGFGSPDDIEIFARMHEGYRSLSLPGMPQWARFNRQLTTEQAGPRGERIAHASSEIMQRSAYYAWRDLMNGESYITAKPNGDWLTIPGLDR